MYSENINTTLQAYKEQKLGIHFSIIKDITIHTKTMFTKVNNILNLWIGVRRQYYVVI